jgi:hypothetical protein
MQESDDTTCNALIIIVAFIVHGINSIRPAILRRTTLIEPMAQNHASGKLKSCGSVGVSEHSAGSSAAEAAPEHNAQAALSIPWT